MNECSPEPTRQVLHPAMHEKLLLRTAVANPNRLIVLIDCKAADLLPHEPKPIRWNQDTRELGVPPSSGSYERR